MAEGLQPLSPRHTTRLPTWLIYDTPTHLALNNQDNSFYNLKTFKI